MWRRLRSTVWRATSVGCAVKTGTNLVGAASVITRAASIPRLVMRRKVSAERAWQERGLLGMQLGGTPSPLAMIGFGKIGEFEINRERFGDTVGLIHSEAGNNLPRLVQ